MKITGLNIVLKALTIDESSIEKVLEKAGGNILANTKASVNSVSGELANSFTSDTTKSGDTITTSVGSDLELAAYSEFGTGSYVLVPPETTDAYTMQWYKNGRGTLRPHPALFPAFRIEIPKVIEELRLALRPK